MVSSSPALASSARACRLRRRASLRVPASSRVSAPERRASSQSAERDRVEVLGLVADDDATLLAVGVEGGRDVAAAQLVQRGPLPRMDLAAVRGQLDDTVAERVERGPERAAGGDLGELVVVADEKHLRADVRRLRHDRGEVARAGHRRLVDHDQGRCG